MVSSLDRCENCDVQLVWARTGRPKRFCSTRCRVAAHRKRPAQLDLLAAAAAAVVAAEAAELRAAATLTDVVSRDRPPPTPVTFRSAGPFGPPRRRTP